MQLERKGSAEDRKTNPRAQQKTVKRHTSRNTLTSFISQLRQMVTWRETELHSRERAAMRQHHYVYYPETSAFLASTLDVNDWPASSSGRFFRRKSPWSSLEYQALFFPICDRDAPS